jgi:hypothetical protein
MQNLRGDFVARPRKWGLFGEGCSSDAAPVLGAAIVSRGSVIERLERDFDPI